MDMSYDPIPSHFFPQHACNNFIITHKPEGSAVCFKVRALANAKTTHPQVVFNSVIYIYCKSPLHRLDLLDGDKIGFGVPPNCCSK